MSHSNYDFTSGITRGDPDDATCGADGSVMLKDLVAYTRRQQIDGADDCELLLYFNRDKLYVFMRSDRYFCACAAGATMEGIYTEGLL